MGPGRSETSILAPADLASLTPGKQAEAVLALARRRGPPFLASQPCRLCGAALCHRPAGSRCVPCSCPARRWLWLYSFLWSLFQGNEASGGAGHWAREAPENKDPYEERGIRQTGFPALFRTWPLGLFLLPSSLCTQLVPRASPPSPPKACLLSPRM